MAYLSKRESLMQLCKVNKLSLNIMVITFRGYIFEWLTNILGYTLTDPERYYQDSVGFFVCSRLCPARQRQVVSKQKTQREAMP